MVNYYLNSLVSSQSLVVLCLFVQSVLIQQPVLHFLVAQVQGVVQQRVAVVVNGVRRTTEVDQLLKGANAEPTVYCEDQRAHAQTVFFVRLKVALLYVLNKLFLIV